MAQPRRGYVVQLIASLRASLEDCGIGHSEGGAMGRIIGRVILVAMVVACSNALPGLTKVGVPSLGVVIAQGQAAHGTSGGTCAGEEVMTMSGPGSIAMGGGLVTGIASVTAEEGTPAKLTGGCFALSLDLKSISPRGEEIRCNPARGGATAVTVAESISAAEVDVREVCTYYFNGSALLTRTFTVTGLIPQNWLYVFRFAGVFIFR